MGTGGMGVLEDQVVVVTGAGQGIGRALAVRAAAEGAHLVLNDLDPETCQGLADELGVPAVPGSAADEAVLHDIIDLARDSFGRGVDVFFANAGIDTGISADRPDSLQSTDADWARMLETNVMSHVRAARLLVPAWLASVDSGGRGGRFVVTASAAGLLTMVGAAPYSVTKHAAVGFAEWLSVTYGDRGVTVQAICPQGVRTAMLEQAGELQALLSHDEALAPEAVAQTWVDSLVDDRFLVLPHPAVAGYYAARATDTDRWLSGMRRLQAKVDRHTPGDPS